jgi:K+-sensing histidine kinase KdpD
MTTESHASSRESSPQTACVTPAANNTVLGHAVQRGLRIPIDSLRTSMENLRSEFGGVSMSDLALGEVLAEVDRLGRNVQHLLDYAYQPEAHAIECTVNEIVYTARFQVPHDMWSALWIARDCDLPGMIVDGPVLSRSIARLIEAAAPLAQSGVLLNVKRTEKGVSFSITYQGASDHLGDPTGLCHAIASRDLAVIGCPLTETASRYGDTTITICVQSNMLSESAA